MAAFIFGERLESEVRRVREHAERSANWYVAGRSRVPGDQPAHIVCSGTVRAVFSWTVHGSAVIRHLSVSTNSSDAYPARVIVFTLAHLFGFVGGEPTAEGLVPTAAAGWKYAVNEDDGCVVVFETIR